MKQKDYTGIVPAQYSGIEIEVDAFKEFENEKNAKDLYELSKSRLLNVNQWKDVAGIVSANFQVVDSKGLEVDRTVMKGDYLKIDIPGPGNPEGGGFDWVQVEDVREVNEGNIQSTAFRVRPAQNPFSDKDEVAHFYSEEATSNFIVIREGTKITARVIDRNTQTNDDSEDLVDKIRDKAVGIGAISVFSKVQWQNLVNGLVEIQIES